MKIKLGQFGLYGITLFGIGYAIGSSRGVAKQKLQKFVEFGHEKVLQKWQKAHEASPAAKNIKPNSNTIHSKANSKMLFQTKTGNKISLEGKLKRWDDFQVVKAQRDIDRTYRAGWNRKYITLNRDNKDSGDKEALNLDSLINIGSGVDTRKADSKNPYIAEAPKHTGIEGKHNKVDSLNDGT